MSFWTKLFGSARTEEAMTTTDRLDVLSDRMERIAQAAIAGKPLPENPRKVREEMARVRQTNSHNILANSMAGRGDAQ